MRSILIVGVALLCLLLSSCQLTDEQRAGLVTGLAGTAAAIDTNGDGVITNSEVRGSGGNIAMWGGVLNTLLLLLGGGGATAATVAIRRASAAQAAASAANNTGEVSRLRTEIDELWDKTHKPTV